MPHLLNLSVFEVMLCWTKILRIVFWVLYATLILVLRKILVIYLVCLSVHVKVAHFVFCCFLRAVDNSGCRRTNPPPPTNTNHKHNHNCQPHALLLLLLLIVLLLLLILPLQLLLLLFVLQYIHCLSVPITQFFFSSSTETLQRNNFDGVLDILRGET